MTEVHCSYEAQTAAGVPVYIGWSLPMPVDPNWAEVLQAEARRLLEQHAEQFGGIVGTIEARVTTVGEPDADPEKWTPDEQLIDRALIPTPGLRMRELSDPDRSWVVAGLKRRGLTAERIADLLHCSLRQVRAVAAEPATILADLYMTERETFADTERMSAAEIQRLDALATDNAIQAERYRTQRDRLIAVGVLPADGETFRCGCGKTRYNTYVDPKTGKTSCREHRRLAVAKHRGKRKPALTDQD